MPTLRMVTPTPKLVARSVGISFETQRGTYELQSKIVILTNATDIAHAA